MSGRGKEKSGTDNTIQFKNLQSPVCILHVPSVCFLPSVVGPQCVFYTHQLLILAVCDNDG